MITRAKITTLAASLIVAGFSVTVAQEAKQSRAPATAPASRPATTRAVESPYQSQRVNHMRATLQSVIKYAIENEGRWPERLELVRPYFPAGAGIELEEYRYILPAKPWASRGEVPVLVEKNPSRADGLFVGFDDTHVAFLNPVQTKELSARFPEVMTERASPPVTRPAATQPATRAR